MARESREDKSCRNNSMDSSSTGFCYSGVSSTTPNIQTQHHHHLMNQIQGFDSNPELFNLTTGMDMLGFPSKNLQQQREVNSVMWKGFFGKQSDHGQSSTSKTTINEHDDDDQSDFYPHDFSETTTNDQNLIVAPDHHLAWQDSTVFPCESNQGLSLSLASNKLSFELKGTSHHHQHQHRQDDDDIRFISANSRDGFFGKFANLQQNQILQDGVFGKAANLHQSNNFQLKSSKYLAPAQELLNEFCSLRTKQQTDDTQKQKLRKTKQLEDQENSRKQSPYSLDLLELQKRKAKLLSMLEEVDRRYRHYCDQMKSVVSSFEVVAGNGAAKVYSALASKAMSRHFRCLRDGIVGQIQATKKAMGDKDPIAPGASKGETPRLRLLDQTLRQQKAIQQMSVLESHPWRPQRGLPERSVSVLRAWLFEHFLHPYPSDVDKHILARQTGLSRSQVSNWFINARVRLWKPMVEEMYLEETKEHDNIASSNGVTVTSHTGDESSQDNSPNPNPRRRCSEDQKPTANQLARIDSECLSSIINNNHEDNDIKNHRNHHHHQHQEQQPPHQQQFGRVGEPFGVIDLDFSSYNHTASAAVSNYSNGGGTHQNFGNGVSLTLGLQQHGESGVNLAFSPTSHHSLIFPRDDEIEDCQPVQYSILEGEAHNLPYRNLMGVQLLHDFAG